LTFPLLSIIRIVAVKELKDFFRDPRSLALSLGLPLVLFPLLFWVLSDNKPVTVQSDRIFQIGIDPAVTIDPAILDSEFLFLCETDENYPLNWRNEYDALLWLDVQEGRTMIIYDNSNPLSISAFRYLDTILSGPPELSHPVLKQEVSLPQTARPMFSQEDADGKMFLGLILPFIFFIFAITCPLPGAADLSSGEKERGCLEPLLSTAAPRSGLILGKLAAASLIGLCSVSAYILGVYLSCLISPDILGPQTMTFSLTFGQIGVLSLLLLLLTCLFTAVEICAGFITKSIREAQLLVMPLLMVGMGAVYTAQSLEIAHKSWIYSHLPLVNLALAVRETALDRMITADVASAIVWSLIYLILMTFLAVRMFQKEFSLVKKTS